MENELTMFQTLLDNWEIVVVGLAAAVASLDKFCLVVISSLKNVKDAWRQAFPKKVKVDSDEKA